MPAQFVGGPEPADRALRSQSSRCAARMASEQKRMSLREMLTAASRAAF
jgi:hypothetical protein